MDRAKTDPLFRKIVEIVSDITSLPPEVIKPESRFTLDLDCTDMEPVEIVLAIKEDFGIDITDQEAAMLETVWDLVEFVRCRL